MEFLIVLLTICLLANIPKANGWDYQHQAKWYDDFSECSFDHQSPIEISSGDAIVSSFMPPVEFHNYSAACTEPATITNTGYSVSVTLSEKCYRPQITGGPLPYDAIYETVSFHFHWGSKDQHGSEHIVDSERYAMEAHFVHQNIKYSSMEEAGKHWDGLAVEALFYRVNASQQTWFDGLQNIVTSLKAIRKSNTNSFIKNATLSALFGNIDTSTFYTYQGSLTTPPCSQAVTWIVFPEAIDVNPEQINEFRFLTDVQGAALVNNYRFIQPKDKRKVYIRRNMTPTYNTVPYVPPPTTHGPQDDAYYE